VEPTREECAQFLDRLETAFGLKHTHAVYAAAYLREQEALVERAERCAPVPDEGLAEFVAYWAEQAAQWEQGTDFVEPDHSHADKCRQIVNTTARLVAERDALTGTSITLGDTMVAAETWMDRCDVLQAERDWWKTAANSAAKERDAWHVQCEHEGLVDWMIERDATRARVAGLRRTLEWLRQWAIKVAPMARPVRTFGLYPDWEDETAEETFSYANLAAATGVPLADLTGQTTNAGGEQTHRTPPDGSGLSPRDIRDAVRGSGN
jgi:hypothetical protein